MEKTKEFGMKVGRIAIDRTKGHRIFTIFVDTEDGTDGDGDDDVFQEIMVGPQELLDLHDALSVATRLQDLMPKEDVAEVVPINQ